MSDGDETLVVISTFIVPAAMESAFLNWWRMTKPFIAAQPGFVSATLHQSLDQRERYRFINVATWRAGEAQRATLSSLWSSVPKIGLPGVEWHPALYEVVEAV